MLALVVLAAPAAAQFKVIGPDGRVTYTDRPSASGGDRVMPLSRVVAAAPATAEPAAALPIELRQVASRYPVHLYTSSDCSPCDSGRQLLQQRGVPFAERRVTTEDDVAALQRSLGWRSVPSITIGTQALRGFNASEWTAFLDAAGYPAESRLPRNWAAPAATPLSPARSVPPVAAVAPPPPAPLLPAAPPPEVGIRF